MESKWSWNCMERKNEFLNSKELTDLVIPQILDSKINTKERRKKIKKQATQKRL